MAECRHGSPLEEAPTLVKMSAPEGVIRRSHNVIPASDATRLRDAKIYLLTSERTASAAEHLSLSLKRTGRATLVGETTRGAGHYGGMIPLDGHTGRSAPHRLTYSAAAARIAGRSEAPNPSCWRCMPSGTSGSC